jgi:hypothetical protein
MRVIQKGIVFTSEKDKSISMGGAAYWTVGNMCMVNQAAPAVGQAGQLFDLQASDGVNESERILSALCQKSFLRLWSQTNVYTDEGFKDGKGATKELCDALIIFGNDVIIFSDKHITFKTERELMVAWARWYRRAIADSVKQLHGTKGWLQRLPERAYLDPQCTDVYRLRCRQLRTCASTW